LGVYCDTFRHIDRYRLGVDKLSVGRKIACLRRQKRWSQLKLAKETGLSRSYIAAIEEGKGHPSLKALVVIAEKLDVGLKELYKRKKKN